MASKSEDVPVTQIIYLTIRTNLGAKLDDTGLWKEALNLCQRAPGFQRLYWGRSLEHPEHGQLHIVRGTLEQQHAFLKSKDYEKVVKLLEQVTGSTDKLLVRHARLKSWGPDDKALARGAPFTGTAIYLNTNDGFDEGAWPLWTHVVRKIDGCLGGSGGPLLEPVETVPGILHSFLNDKQDLQTFQRCNLVYVGWQTTKHHDDYHHTKHFKQHSIILNCMNEGFAEYGHIVFEGSREGEKASGGVSAKL